MSKSPTDGMERDSRLSAIYRAAAQDEPPPALDDAIRAAARRAVGARPRPAGFGFGHSWRVPLSIAAVLVLSVSLVTLLREEAPELVELPRAESPAADMERKPATVADSAAVTATQGFVPDADRSKNIGLKPPQPTSSSGLVVRTEPAAQPAPLRKEMPADRMEADTGVPREQRAKRHDAPASAAEQPAQGIVAGEPARQAAQLNAPEAGRAPPPTPIADARGNLEAKTQPSADADYANRGERLSRTPVASAPAPSAPAMQAAPAPVAAAKQVSPVKAESQAAGATAARESYVELPPEKWLERIEELRKQGKLDEAKAQLAEFRRRFPNYRLPDALRDWAGP